MGCQGADRKSTSWQYLAKLKRACNMRMFLTGIAQRVVSGGQSRLQVLSPGDTQSQELLKLWRSMAEEAWNTPSHMGWSIVTEALVRP